MKIQIAIDGPAASGKSTAARGLAARLGGLYVNTGDMYRTIAWACLQKGVDARQEPEKVSALLPGWDLRYRPQNDGTLLLVFNGCPVRQEDIRAPETAAVVSYVAQIPAVRDWMTSRQRECAELEVPVVMEGRDIGTVILPQATYKFFVTATPEERARRRLAQSDEVATGATLAKVAADIAERDRIDSTRAVAPLRPAEDAVMVVTDGMTREQVVDHLLSFIKEAQR